MKNLFDTYINSVLTQLNEQDNNQTNLSLDIVNSFKDVLSPMANNQEIDAKNNSNIDKNRLAAAISAGVIEQKDDGTHNVSDAAIAHISLEDPDIGGKFAPSQQGATNTAPTAVATVAPKKQQINNQQPAQQNTQQSTAQSTSTNNAGVVSSVYSPNKR